MKVAVLHSRKGIAGLWTPGLEATSRLAVAEVNQAGGVQDAPLELVHGDCGLDHDSARSVVDHMLHDQKVDAIVGQHTSNVRDAIRTHVNGRLPYIYTSQHEGLSVPGAVTMIGATDGELLWPAISWLIAEKKAQRFFFVGNDYIWPRAGLATCRSLIAHEGAQLVGHALMPFEVEDHTATLDRIRAAQPDVVVQALVGDASVRFNRAFAEAGLDRSMLRLGLLVDDTVLCGIGPDATEGLYSVSNYFADLRSRENLRFLDSYHTAFGRLAPPAGMTSMGCYEGVHLLAALAGRRADPGGQRMAELARRPLSRDAARQHLRAGPVGRGKRVHIARADGVAMSIVWSLTLN